MDSTLRLSRSKRDNHLIPKTTYSTFGQVRTRGLTTAMSRSSYTRLRDNWRCQVLRRPGQNAPQSWASWNHASVQFWTLTSNRSNRPLARVQFSAVLCGTQSRGLPGTGRQTTIYPSRGWHFCPWVLRGRSTAAEHKLSDTRTRRGEIPASKGMMFTIHILLITTTQNVPGILRRDHSTERG